MNLSADQLRKLAEAALVHSMLENNLWRARNQKQKERMNELNRLMLTDPSGASDLIVEDILSGAKADAEEGQFNSVYKQDGYWNKLPEEVISKLKALDFAAEIKCGHGHGSYDDCNGKRYSTCWQELVVSWKKED
ncbi:MAG: hypothetical protein Q7S36_00220 [Candidatus Liptonbacteria bacterium]|nr:hypothetical protein [Candidatus Liptonbacteria bacterium]